MDGGRLTRMRWRRRGAWLWPAFAALTVADAVVGHLLPPTGETQTLVAAGVSACVLNLIAVIVFSRPGGALVRRVRRDLPVVVARDYAGTVSVIAVAAALLTTGLAHRSTVISHRRDEADAITRAQAWIGDRAPAIFRGNVAQVNTFTIEPGSIYRSCVPSNDRTRSYCVIVKEQLPFARSVSFAGYEPNSVFGQGVG